MATYYINADTGNDTTGDGSQGNPWLTLSKANSSSTSGDTIFCQSSTNYYPLTSNITFSNRDIVGENVDNVIFSNGGVGSSTTYISCSSNAYLNIKNITFTNIAGNGSYQTVILGSGASIVNIEKCIFTGLFPQRIISRISGSTTYNITSCLFYNLAASIFWYGSDMIFNIINNVFHFSVNTDYLFDYVGYSGGSSINAINTIFLNDLGSAVDFRRGSITINGTNNCLYGSFVDYPTDSSNLINTDPLFIDPANRNYNLSPSSPCIDAGTLV